MISLTSQIILWVLLGLVIWYAFREWFPRDFLRWVWIAIALVCLVLLFLSPTNAISLPLLSILSLPFKPLGLSLLLLVLATKDGVKKLNSSQVVAAVTILAIFSMPFVAYGMAYQVERMAVGLKPMAATAPAIVVLGWGTTQPQQGSRSQIQLTDKGDRLRYAAALYKAGRASRIIVSAGRRVERSRLQNDTEASDIKKILVEEMNLPSSAILLDSKGMDARSAALEVSQILKREGLGDRIHLVTSALNMRRAALTFAKLDLKVIPKPTDFYTYPTADYFDVYMGFTDFVPSAEALALSTKVIEEYLLSIYSFMRSWLASPLVV